jgi:hypothetical protein
MYIITKPNSYIPNDCLDKGLLCLASAFNNPNKIMFSARYDMDVNEYKKIFSSWP